jgi:hypothetical protein
VTFLPAEPKLTEARFMAQVVEYARLMGWRTYHTRRSEGSEAGFPDLVLVRRPRIVWAELKSERGKATPQQLVWLLELLECRQEVYLWRPEDWPRIERILR